jgi:hypothetical protein
MHGRVVPQLITTWSVESVFVDYPMTFQASIWYSTASYSALAMVAAIALYGFRIAIGNWKSVTDSNYS